MSAVPPSDVEFELARLAAIVESGNFETVRRDAHDSLDQFLIGGNLHFCLHRWHYQFYLNGIECVSCHDNNWWN